MSATSPLRSVLLSGATTGTSQAINCAAFPYVSVFLKGTGTTSSGVVTIETADYDPFADTPYTGTWSPITTLNASDVTGGQQKFVALAPAANAYIRARITTTIGGSGTVDVVLRGVSS